MTRTRLFTLAALLLAPLTIPAAAHHSYAMFDMQKSVVLDASVVRFKWQNPHAFIEADVTTNAGTERWAIEMTSPNNLANAGFKRSSFKPGDTVSLKIHPLRDGSKGGSFLGAKLADGSTLGEWK